MATFNTRYLDKERNTLKGILTYQRERSIYLSHMTDLRTVQRGNNNATSTSKLPIRQSSENQGDLLSKSILFDIETYGLLRLSSRGC